MDNSINSQVLIENLSEDEKIRLLNGEGSWQTYNAQGKLPSFFMSDGPHGLRKQESENYSDLNKSNVATCFPTASCMASSWDKNALYRLGQAIADEALAENVNMVLGPGINIKRSSLCGRNFEYFSEDPYLSGILAASYINGMQNKGVAACVKHFACNSQEKRRQTSNSIVDERTLREIYLRAFEIVVKQSAPLGIMGSYNRLNGEYVCASHKLLTQILRNEWGFKGIVISDWGACIDAAKCVKAGMDLAMPDSGGYLSDCLKKSLAEKVISLSDIEKSGKRVLDVALWFKEEQKKYKGDRVNCTKPAVDYSVQHETAKQLAEGSAVLLKNEKLLPLKKGKVIVIGELAEIMKFQGGGSSHITTKEYPNAISALENLGYTVLYEKGYYSGFCKTSQIEKMNKPLIDPALALAKKAAEEGIPVLFFAGLTERYEGEGFDRESLELPMEQKSLLTKVLECTNNVALINFSGAPVNFAHFGSVKAILQMYLAGEAVGEAVADLVSGVANPSGKLAESFPCAVEDISCNSNFGGEEDNICYKENVFVGYRDYESNNKVLQFEFGYGLSYTTFEYKDLQVQMEKNPSEAEQSVLVKFTVTNTGSVEGSEVVQIYVCPELSAKEKQLRPVKELRGFEKVFLKAGESKDVCITLDENAFKVYSQKENAFVTIGGKYKIQVAASVKDVRLEKELEIQGDRPLEHLVSIGDEFYKENSIQIHTKGSYTLSDSLGDMAKSCRFIRNLIRMIEKGIVAFSKGKSKEDPSIKIVISAIKENPLESLISTSGGAISEKMAKLLVKKANK